MRMVQVFALAAIISAPAIASTFVPAAMQVASLRMRGLDPTGAAQILARANVQSLPAPHVPPAPVRKLQFVRRH